MGNHRHKHGSIGLIGRPSSGKTAYLVALDLKTGLRGRLAHWDLDKSSELPMYVQSLGEELGDTGRRELRETRIETASDLLELYRGYRRGRIPLPRFLRQHFDVAIPDVAGEAYDFVSGHAEPDTDEDKDARDLLLQQLIECSALICLIDIKPYAPPGPEDERLRRQKVEVAEQVRALDNVLTQILERRKGKDRITLAVALTKCDLLSEGETELHLRTEDCHRWQYFEDRPEFDPIEAGFRQHSANEVSYDLETIDASLSPDRRDSKFGEKVFWGDDPKHHDAVARDWLQVWMPGVYGRLEEIRTRVELELVMISSWGQVPPRVNYEGRDVEVVPWADEITPVRHLAPLRSVLDRLHGKRTRRHVGRWLWTGVAAAALLYAAWPGWIDFWIGRSRTVLAAEGDLDSAGKYADLAELTPLFEVSPARWRSRSAANHFAIGAALGRADDWTKAVGRFRTSLQRDPSAASLARVRSYVDEVARAKIGLDTSAALEVLTGAPGLLESGPAHELVGDVILAGRAELVKLTASALQAAAASGETAELERVKAALEQHLAGQAVVESADFYYDGVESGFASSRALAQASLALVEFTLLAAVDVSADRPALKRLESIQAVHDRALAALALFPAGDRSQEALDTREITRRIHRQCYTLDDLAFDANRADRDFEGDVKRIQFLKGLAGAAPADPWRTELLTREVGAYADDLWERTLALLQTAATQSPGDFEGPLSACVYLGEEFGLGLRNVDEVRLSFRLKGIDRGIEEGAFPPASESVLLIQHMMQILDTKGGAMAAELERDRLALTETFKSFNSQVLSGTLDDWREPAEILARRDRRLRTTIEDIDVYERLASASFDGYALQQECEEVLALLANDERSNRFAILGFIGRKLTSQAAELDAAVALRLCLESARDHSEIAAEDVQRVIGHFRSELWSPSVTVEPDAQRRRVQSLLEALESSPDPSPDYLLLFGLEPGNAYNDGLREIAVRKISEQLTAGAPPRDYVQVLETLSLEAGKLLQDGSSAEVDGWLHENRGIFSAVDKLALEPSCDELVRALAGRKLCAKLWVECLAGDAPDPETIVERATPLLHGLLAGRSPLLSKQDRSVLSSLAERVKRNPSTRANAFGYFLAINNDNYPEEVVTGVRGRLRGVLRESIDDPSLGRWVSSYLSSLGSRPSERVELRELFARFRKEEPTTVSERMQLVCRGLANHLEPVEREQLFKGELEQLAAVLTSSARPPRLDPKRIAASRECAVLMHVTGAIEVLDVLAQRERLLDELGATFVAIPGGDGKLISMDEITLAQYDRLLAMSAMLRIEFKAGGEAYSYSAPGRMNKPYESRSKASKGSRVEEDQGVFGVSAEAVQAFLVRCGARLPTASEWSQTYDDGIRIRERDGALAARTGAELKELGDVTASGVRGMHFGVREWVTSTSNGFVVLGGSWFHDGDEPTKQTKAGDAPGLLDIGFRIVLDPLPRQVREYLK